MELLEREDYLVQLKKYFDQVEKGAGHTIFLIGEAGIGKTSLVNLFEREVKSKALFYLGACDSLFTPRPLGPLYDVSIHLGVHIAEMLRNEKNRALIFATILKQLTTSAIPSVLVFEDTHWADDATVDFIKYLARRINRARCLFIVTCRDSEIHSTHSLRRIFGELPPDTFSKIVVKPLSREAVNSLAMAKGNPNGAEVYSLTGGNPFYVTEILVSGMQRIPEHVKDSILTIFHSKEATMQALLEFLSILPSRIDFRIIERIKDDFSCDIDDCIWSGIIVRTPEYLYFKHELFRLAIEESLLPSKRKSYHKKMLRILSEINDGSHRFSQLVHHARQADEKKLVVEIAPKAAREASIAGAHTEASRHYMTAIESTTVRDSHLATLYDCHAYECFLTSQINAAISSQQQALDIWREQKISLRVGNALRFLSRLSWFLGKKDAVMTLALESISVLEQVPLSRELALSYSHMSQIYMIYNDPENSLHWGRKAIDLAAEMHDEEILAPALNTVGTVLSNYPSSQSDGEKNLNQSLSIAVTNNMHEHVARAYSNHATILVLTKNYKKAFDNFEAGLRYCETHDLNFFRNYMLSEKIKLLLETGEWHEASKNAQALHRNSFLPAVIRTGAVAVLSRISTRRGEFEKARELIDEGKKISGHTQEAHRIVPILVSELELCWIANAPLPARELTAALGELFPDKNNSWYYSELAYWMNKCGVLTTEDRDVKFTKPFHFEILGDWKSAAEIWKELGCPYERALSLFNGEQEHQRAALAILDELGASAVYSMLRARLKTMGIKNIPKGIRKSTRNNPAQLTNRQIDILVLLREGLQNVEIANKLFISTKTVSHHVSAILSQFEVNSRTKAVALAKKRGILR
jgi:DNA-binding CsgD family transcriptional regulator